MRFTCIAGVMNKFGTAIYVGNTIYRIVKHDYVAGIRWYQLKRLENGFYSIEKYR